MNVVTKRIGWELTKNTKGEQLTMGRAELRRQQREQSKKSKTYTLTEQQIDDMKMEISKDAVNKAFFMSLAIPISILAADYWEKTANKRCNEFFEKCMSLFDSVENGYVTIEDLAEAVLNDLGIDLIDKEGTNNGN